MAEFCKKCFERIEGDHSDKKLIMSAEKDLCEGCDVIDYTVVSVREKGFLSGVVEFVKRFGV